MENRLAQMEHIPANQTHDQPQTDKFDARQLENILARLILMESRIGAVEKKVMIYETVVWVIFCGSPKWHTPI